MSASKAARSSHGSTSAQSAQSAQSGSFGSGPTSGLVPSPAGSAHSGRRSRHLLAATLFAPLLVAVMLTAFAWPASELGPHHLPIGVVGPGPAVEGVRGQLAAAAGQDGFDVRTYADEAAARTAIRDREVYGALVVGGPGGAGGQTAPTVLTASAASPMVAALLAEAAPDGARVRDVVPTSPDDPRGVVFASALLPLVLVGLATGVVFGVRTRPGAWQALALIGSAALAGLAVAGVAQAWLGALGGDWWVDAGVAGLMVLAMAATVAGLAAVLGVAGLGLGAALTVVLGNPLSGVSSAPELLPGWAGALGQLLPPGAGGQALRSTAYFDGAAAGRPLLVLGAWAVAGLALVLLGALRRPAPSETP